MRVRILKTGTAGREYIVQGRAGRKPVMASATAPDKKTRRAAKDTAIGDIVAREGSPASP